MLEAMLPYAGAAFTVTPDNPRAMKAEELASEAEAIVARLWKERAGKPEKTGQEQEIVRAQELWEQENSPQGAGVMGSRISIKAIGCCRACSSIEGRQSLALEQTGKRLA